MNGDHTCSLSMKHWKCRLSISNPPRSGCRQLIDLLTIVTCLYHKKRNSIPCSIIRRLSGQDTTVKRQSMTDVLATIARQLKDTVLSALFSERVANLVLNLSQSLSIWRSGSNHIKSSCTGLSDQNPTTQLDGMDLLHQLTSHKSIDFFLVNFRS